MEEVGKGMSVNQRSLHEVVLAYIEAWSTPEEAARRDLLDVSLADDALYTDPAYEVRGREEIASHIGRSLSGEAYDGAGAGARIPINSGVDQHYGMFRFSWVMIDPQEQQILLEGMDFVELAAWSWQPMVASSASMASLERFHPYRRAGPSTWCGAADSSAFEPLERGRSCYVITSYCPYSPKCVEWAFCEVRIHGVLRSSRSTPTRNVCRNAWETVVL